MTVVSRTTILQRSCGSTTRLSMRSVAFVGPLSIEPPGTLTFDAVTLRSTSSADTPAADIRIGSRWMLIWRAGRRGSRPDRRRRAARSGS